MGDFCTLIEFMPVYLRQAHLEAGNSGYYPHNGAQRVWVRGVVAEEDLDGEWSGVIEVGVAPDGEPVLDDAPADAWAPVGGDD
jgi:hypothetical protein